MPELEIVLRYIHFLAGVMWIGVLWYFNLIQTPFFATELGGQAKSAMTRGLVPSALWYFRWGAMFTFLSGWIIVLLKLHVSVAGSAQVDGLSFGAATVAALGLPYFTQILTGGVMGTIMWFNVWFIIWPAQRDFVIRNAQQVAEGGEPIPGAAEKAALAARASRTNTLFSIPMLFFMGTASHYTFIDGANDAPYWIAALALMLALELNAVIGTGPRQKYLASVSGTVHAGVILLLLLGAAGFFLN